MPTGNPRCPEQVRHAKRINELILEKAGSFDGGAVQPEALLIKNGTMNEEARDEGSDAGDGPPVAVGAAACMLSANHHRHESISEFQKQILLDLERE